MIDILDHPGMPYNSPPVFYTLNHLLAPMGHVIIEIVIPRRACRCFSSSKEHEQVTSPPPKKNLRVRVLIILAFAWACFFFFLKFPT